MFFKIKYVHHDNTVSYSEIEADCWDEATQIFDELNSFGVYKGMSLYSQSEAQRFAEWFTKMNSKLESWL